MELAAHRAAVICQLGYRLASKIDAKLLFTVRMSEVATRSWNHITAGVNERKISQLTPTQPSKLYDNRLTPRLGMEHEIVSGTNIGQIGAPANNDAMAEQMHLP